MAEPATDTTPADGSYVGSFGGMAADASRATKAYADVTREKVAAETRSEGQMVTRGEEDRKRALEAFKNEGIKPEEFKPWNAEAEHKKFESDPIQGFGSTGAVFAMIASAFSKAPMLSAIEGMTGALGAIKEGNEAAYNRAFTSWKENIQVAKDRHQIEHQAYTDALALGTHDLQLSQAKLRAEAARFGDKQILALADNGMVKEIYDAVSARNRAMESAASLAENTTIRTLQQQQLKASFAQIDAAKGPPGPDGQPTEIPPAVKTAQKLNVMNTIMASGKMTQPQQVAMAQLIMQHPDWPIEKVLEEAEKRNVIRQPGGASGSLAQERNDIRARALQLQAEAKERGEDMPLTVAEGMAKTEAKAKSETATAKRMQTIQDEAKRRRAENPKLSQFEAETQAAREYDAKSRAPSANRIDDIRWLYDQSDNAIAKSEKILKFIETHVGAAGLVGKLMRGEEIAENITGISTKSDRNQMRREVHELQEYIPQILNGQKGRPLKAAQDKVDDVVAGLNAGDTGPNTRRAFRELIAELKKRKQDFSGRITTGFDPARSSSGAPDAEENVDPAKAGPNDWLKMYPKKSMSDEQDDPIRPGARYAQADLTHPSASNSYTAQELEESIRRYSKDGSVRVRPNDRGAKELLQNLPPDMSSYRDGDSVIIYMVNRAATS